VQKLTPWRTCQQPFSKSVSLAAAEHAQLVYPEESVGIVVDNEYLALKNSAKDPINHFKVLPQDLIKYSGRISGVIHSHVLENSPGHPSLSDQETQIAWGIPFGIQLINRAGPGNIIWFGDTLPVAEYTGRPYIYGVYDCFSIFRDYYRTELGITMPEFPRADGFWHTSEEMYLNNTSAAGFYQITLKELQPADIILIKLRSKIVNHAILYIEGDTGLHHMPMRTSAFDTVSKYIAPSRAMFHSVWRHENFKENK
jgi:proteasome lid subunit RPN8/RPN11